MQTIRFLLALALVACTPDAVVEQQPDDTGELTPAPETPDVPVIHGYKLPQLLELASYRVEAGIGSHEIVDGGLLLSVEGNDEYSVGILSVTFEFPPFHEIIGILRTLPEGGLDDDGREYIALYVGDIAIEPGGRFGPDLAEDESVDWHISEIFEVEQTEVTIEVASDAPEEALWLYHAQLLVR